MLRKKRCIHSLISCVKILLKKKAVPSSQQERADRTTNEEHFFPLDKFTKLQLSLSENFRGFKISSVLFIVMPKN